MTKLSLTKERSQVTNQCIQYDTTALKKKSVWLWGDDSMELCPCLEGYISSMY